MPPFSVRLPARYVFKDGAHEYSSLAAPAYHSRDHAVFAPALSLGLLSYRNGFSATAATVVGTATPVVVLWAVATEP